MLDKPLPKTWKRVKVADISGAKGAAVSGPFGSNIGKKFFVAEGVPVIRGNNLTLGEEKFIDNGFIFITEKKAYELRNCEAISDDIIFTAAGTLGQVGVIPKKTKFPKYIISNKQLRLRCDKNIALPIYCYYWFSSWFMRVYIKNQNTGSSIPLITLNTLRNLPVNLPPIDVQNNIIAILSAYDDLIESNNRRIKILEEMAQTICNEWFVKFRFPWHSKVRMVKSELGDMPEGWGVKQLNDVIDIRSGFAFKSGTFTHEGKYRLVTIRNVQNGKFVAESDSRLQDIPEKTPEYCLLKNGDILLSLTGNVGRVCLCYGKDYLLNQRVAKLVPKDKADWSYVYFMYLQPQFRTKLEMISTGVAQQNLSPVEMGKIKILYPTEILRKSYGDLCNPILKNILMLFQKNSILNQARDLLLPRLISGELNIENLNIKVNN